MWLGVLGPLVVRPADRTSGALVVGAAKQRTVLALLAVRRRQRVTVETIVDEVWQHDPPLSAIENVRTYVRELRRLLGDQAGRLVTRSGGYLFDLGDEEYDAAAFTHAVHEAQRALRGRQLEAAVDRFGDALRYWRGDALEGVPAGVALSSYGQALTDSRTDATEGWLEARSRLGDPAAVIELRRLVTDHPARRSAWRALVEALDNAGDASSALKVVRQARKVLSHLGARVASELDQLERQVTHGTRPLGRPTIVPTQLPADLPTFTGREAELAALDEFFGTLDRRVVALTGMGGVGKSALAVHWAHRVRQRFPDGQLYLDLRGFSPANQPLTAMEAIRDLLDALGVPPERMPSGLDAQVGLYRTLLSDRQLLLVFDNVRDPDHARPLLPGSGPSVAVLTSRHSLAALVATADARVVPISVVSENEAYALLARRIGRTRLQKDSVAATRIVTACQGLPLALAIVAARVSMRPDLDLPTVAGELAGGLRSLALDQDPLANVRGVFSWSYTQLDEFAARLFRMLAAHPGPDITTPAAASLMGVAPSQAYSGLTELTTVALLTETASGRYRRHDLVAAYANELAQRHDSPQGRSTALERLLGHYLHTADGADRLLAPTRERMPLEPPAAGVQPDSIDTHESAMAWFDAEAPVLLALLRSTVEDPTLAPLCARLAYAMFTYFSRRARWNDQAETQELALATATRSGSPAEEVRTRRLLARAYIQLRRYGAARAELSQSLRLAEQTGDLLDQGYAHFTLGWACEQEGELATALQHANQAVRCYVAADNRALEATAWNAVGWCHAQLGHHDEAIAACTRGLALHVALGNTSGQASTLDSLGHAEHLAGRHGAAIEHLRESLTLFEELGATYNTTRALRHLAEAQLAAGDPDTARHNLRRALDVLEDLEHPDLTETHTRLGEIQAL